jgi:hypothetical protein
MVNLHVYVLHTPSLTERRKMCNALEGLLRTEIREGGSQLVLDSWEYVTDYPVSELVIDKVQKLVNLDPLTDEKTAKFSQHIRPLTLPAVSNLLKHYRALTKIASSPASADHAYLVLEDDVCFDGAVRANLEKLLVSDHARADILFCGFPHTIPSEEPIVPLDGVFDILPGCDAYIIKPSTARILASKMVPFKFGCNLQFSYMAASLGLNLYMCKPNIFIEGSKLGICTSTIQVNNALMYNQAYVEMLRIVQKPSFAIEDKERMEKLYELSKFPQHPDMLYIRGVYFLKDGKFHQAKEVFDKAYESYLANGVELSKNSLFLKRYIEVFKYVQ